MDYWTLKKKAIMGSMQSGRLAEAEGYPLKLENAIKGSMKDYRIWGNKKGKNYLDISKIVATPDSTANVVVTEVDTSTGSIYINTVEGYAANGYCNTGKSLKVLAPHLEVGKTYYLNGTSPSSNKFMYLITSKVYWDFGKAITITEDDLNSTVILYGLAAKVGDGTGLCKIEGLSITEEASTEYEPYQENDGLGAFSGNLLDTDYFSASFIGSSNGITFVDNQDGTITLNGTATKETVIGIILSSKYLKIPAGNYVLSGGTSTVYLQGKMKGDDTISWFDRGNGVILSLSEDIDFRFNIRVRAGTTLNNFVVKPQLEEGDTPTEYRPHNYIDVVTSGKNLFDKSKYSYTVGYYNNDGIYNTSSNGLTAYTDNYSAVFPNRKYHCSSLGGYNGAIIAIYFYSKSKEWISRAKYTVTTTTLIKGYTFTTPNNCYYVRFQIFLGSGSNETPFDKNTFQLEEGTEATPYIEAITTTIDLTGHNSIMPNEYIDFRNGCIVRSDGTEEEIILPKIPLHKGYNIITASDAELEATKMYGKYLKKG